MEATNARASIVRNTVWSLAGIATPLLVGLYSIPQVIRGLGTERFGILALAWTIIGYFGVFDIGLGRALTHAVAQRTAAARDRDFGSLVWTALALMAGVGLVAAALVASCAHPLVGVLKVPERLGDEATRALMVLALAIPLTTVSAGLRGIAEGVQEFFAVNVIRAVLGALTLAGPLVALWFSPSLVAVMVVLLLSRVLVTAAFGALALRHLPALRTGVRLSRAGIGPLLSFGGWTTVGNVLGPLLSNADRFLISSLVSLTAVAYYTTPQEIVSKLLVLPAALVAVLFPAFTAEFHLDRARVAVLYRRAARFTFAVLFPVTLAAVVMARPLLRLWLGADFALHSSPVLQILAGGVLFNALAYLPSILCQASGRPDLPAKLNALELALYLPALAFVLPRWGIEGAAALWTLRTTVDAVLLLLAARALLGRDRGERRPILLPARFTPGAGDD